MKIEIDVTDWVDEAEQSPLKFKDQGDIIAAMAETSIKPLQAGRLATVFREMGVADEDILPPNKINLQMGAACFISQVIARQRTTVEINSKPYDVRLYVAQATTDETGDKPEAINEFTVETIQDLPSSEVTLVEYNDEAAQERIMRYLMTNVMGRIKERLTLIAAGKGDVKAVAKELKREIDSIVKELTQ